MPGGAVGPDVFIAEQEPTYQVGESVLLYLDRPTQAAGLPLVFAADALQITPDGQAVGLYTHVSFSLAEVRSQLAQALAG